MKQVFKIFLLASSGITVSKTTLRFAFHLTPSFDIDLPYFVGGVLVSDGHASCNSLLCISTTTAPEYLKDLLSYTLM